MDFGKYVAVLVAPAPSEKPDTMRGWLFPAVAAAVVLIAVLGAAAWWQPWVTRVEAANVADMAFPLPDKPSIAVLPFDNLSADEDQRLTDGVTAEITGALIQIPGLFVISRSTTSTYKGKSASHPCHRRHRRRSAQA